MSISFLRSVVVIIAGAHKQRDTTWLIMNNVLINYVRKPRTHKKCRESTCIPKFRCDQKEEIKYF